VESPARFAALEILERVAEGRMDGASPELEVQMGLKPELLRSPWFKDGSVRAYAIRRIGEVDLPEALTYLQHLKKTDLERDTTGMVWPAAQIALRQAQLNRIPDEPGKVLFLENTTGEQSAAASWAVNELCESGSYRSLGFIRESIRKRNPSRASEDTAFCEARMAVVSRNPDRIKALGSLLTVSEGATDPILINWAIIKLEAMKSPRADAELERYSKEIDGLSDDSPLKRALQLTRPSVPNRLLQRP
jgi:hypothetical protein